MRMGARGSFWNCVVPRQTQIAQTSADYAARLWRQSRYGPTSTPVSGPYPRPWNTVINCTTYSVPVYNVPLDQPRTCVALIDTLGVRRTDSTWADGLVDAWASVPLPLLEHCKPGVNRGGSSHQIEANGLDGHLVVICGREMWEFWRFRPEADGSFAASWGGYVPDITRWSGVFTNDWGARASGLGLACGLIRSSDIRAGLIRHGLALAVAASGWGPYSPLALAPAVRGDTRALLLGGSIEDIDTDRLPHGTRFRLPASFSVADWRERHKDVQGLNSHLLAMLTQAVRDYGLTIVDSATGVLACFAEDDRTFGTPYGPPMRWPMSFGSHQRRLAMQHLPWSEMEQIEPKAP